MEYVIDKNVRVSNNSWGGGSYSQALYDVIEAAQAVGHIFVASAGNDGLNTDIYAHYPSSYDLPNIISVAATDNDDALAVFPSGAQTNYGPTSVDLGAPGVRIYSTIPGSYGYGSGTSMASPHVTGVVALVMSGQPAWTWPQVRDRIISTVRPVDSLMGVTVTGGVVSAMNVGDCNGNGVLDELDILSGTSQDCSGNGLPDECETDCNSNGAADSCDVFFGTSDDCNGNVLPDECETDCNNNEVPDSCDVAAGTSADCNSDVIPDECQLSGNDCNGNQIPDDCDIAGATSVDCQPNGIPDECEPDCNDNDVADYCDIRSGTSEDCNGNMFPDECDLAEGTSYDCEGNGVLDDCELDCNGNAIGDACDVAEGTSLDCNASGFPDECEADCNGNGVPDDCDVAAGSSADCTGNGVPDECEPDCNHNGAADSCDIADATSADANANRIPDECDVIVFVDVNASGASNGSSWTDAYADLQDALDFAAQPGNGVTEIWVAQGTYTADRGTGVQAATFQLVNGVTLYGGFAAGAVGLDERDPGAHATILSGDLNGDDGLPKEPVETDCCTTHEYPGCDNEDCMTAVCALAPACCEDQWSAGCEYWSEYECCEICTTHNLCDNSYHVVTGSGTDATTVLDGFTIAAGQAMNRSYMYNCGGALRNLEGSPTVLNCRLFGNRAKYEGGAVENSESSYPAFINCMFYGNESRGGGGAIFNRDGSSPTFINCTFTGNTARSSGGAVFNWPDANPNFINCTFSGNHARYGGAIFNHSPNNPTLTNSILWGNTDEALQGEFKQIAYGDPVINFSCVQGWSGSFGGVGNFGDDPQLLDADGPDDVFGTEDDNLQLSADSPCIDAGYNLVVPVTRDLLGYARFLDVASVADTGPGAPPVVDLGAHEHGLDCNGNEINDVDDLAAGTSLDCNGNAVPDECEPDCNHNGVADDCEPDEDCNGNGIRDICDIGAGTSADCNDNLVPDDCDLAVATSVDLNGNGVPDECELPPLPASPPHDVPKNRYVSFAPNNTARVAFQVEMASSAYFPNSTGVLGWVGEPAATAVARVVSERVDRVWTEPTVHLGDCAIVPVASYALRAITAGASEDEAVNFSEALAVDTIAKPGTNFWADAVGALGYFCDGDEGNPGCDPLDNTCPAGQPCEATWPGPDGSINFCDVNAAVFAFARRPGTVWPHWTWVDIHGDDSGDPTIDPPNTNLNFSDIQQMVLAFQGNPYPFSDPADCP